MKMACQMIHSWTFSGLVGAFLDLAIAYLLLCASALAFFTSKFLDFFGLSLPCPCDGLFGNPKNNYCFQKQLVDGPCEKIGTVHWQLRSKFPFDSMFVDDPNVHTRVKSAKEANQENGNCEFEGEASCSSYSDGKMLEGVGGGSVSESEQIGAVKLEARKEQYLDHKGKKDASRRSSHSLRRHRKGGPVDSGKSFLVSSFDMVQSDEQELVTPPYRIGKMGTEASGVSTNSGGPSHSIHHTRKECSVDFGNLSASLYDKLQSDTRDISIPPSSISKMENEVTEVPSSSDTSGPERVSHHQLNEPVGNTKLFEKDTSSVDNLCSEEEKLADESNDKTMVRVLEQALDEEHTARTSLCYELEKERSAAATAADEAMAMILRLQEEKASIEMEARQYQRMIEEKSAYDAEEMNILKEILIRREREKHFLEKQVEEYRQILFGNESMDVDMHDVAATQAQRISLHSSEELMLMLEREKDSFSEKSKFIMANSSPDYDVVSTGSQNGTLASGKEVPVPDSEDGLAFASKQLDMHLLPNIDSHSHVFNSMCEISHEFQGKGIVSVDDREIISRGTEGQVVNPEGHIVVEKTIPPNVGKLDSSGSTKDHGSKGPPNSASNADTSVHDVHIIDHKSHTCNERSAEKCQPSANAHIDISEKYRSMTRLGTELEVNIIGADMTGESLLDGSQGKALPCNMRRNSMSAVDYERCKIDNKVNSGSSDMELKDVRRNSMTAVDYERWKIDNKVDRGSADRVLKDGRRNSMTAVDYERGKTGNKLYRVSSDMSPACSDLRRNSMSAVDFERWKLDNEVEWLRERLRSVQEGRGKLNFSVGHREREKVQLKLLEDIASQLQEIRQLTEPGKSKSQAALPPPSAKIMSKKRRWKTLSLGVHRST